MPRVVRMLAEAPIRLGGTGCENLHAVTIRFDWALAAEKLEAG